MNLERLKYIKSVNDQCDQWAYEDFGEGAYFPLNFRKGEGVEAHAAKLSQGDLIILSQKYKDTRYLSHVVEIVNQASEDQSQWKETEWGIVRWVKVLWAADKDSAPVDKTVIQANWGWQDTKAKSLSGSNLMTR